MQFEDCQLTIRVILFQQIQLLDVHGKGRVLHSGRLIQSLRYYRHYVRALDATVAELRISAAHAFESASGNGERSLPGFRQILVTARAQDLSIFTS